MNLSRSLTALTVAPLVAALSALAAVATVGVAAAPAAAATTATPSVSANWAGYVASGTDAETLSPTTFSKVSGTWVEPKADCNAVTVSGPTSSAFWVGLGGDASDSNALEQTGTEVDCSSAGTASYFAWYELVPANSVPLHLVVKPGDRIAASVGVQGSAVTISMRDLTRGTGVTKTLQMRSPDTTSAEWIAEAPSVCASSTYCNEQTLTDFGTVKFSDATAVSDGHIGSITSSLWNATAVTLESAERGGFGPGGFGHQFGGEIGSSDAIPTDLSGAGTDFAIAWKNESDSEPQGGYSGGYGGGGYGGGYGGGGYGGGGLTY